MMDPTLDVQDHLDPNDPCTYEDSLECNGFSDDDRGGE
jgi:hypothetical protein